MSHVALLLFAFLGLFQDEDLSDLAGMSEQDRAAIENSMALTPSNAQFKKILYRTGTVDPLVLQQWGKSAKDKMSFEDIAGDPNRHRFFPYSMNAIVQSVHRFDFSEEDAKNFLSGLYIARCKTTDGIPFILASRSSVASWPLEKDLADPQPVQFDGFFLGSIAMDFGEQFSSSPQPVFVARRFAWHPDVANEALNVDSSVIALSKSGVDVSLLDIVKSRKGKPIGIREGVCFWQMMSACKDPTLSVPEPRIGFASMLRDPVNSVGKSASLRGRVRQCVPVKVTEPEAANLLGTDTWYQLTVFPDLDGRPIQVATRDGKPEVYQSAFPVTVCVVNLPTGFDSETIVGNVFQSTGFFYRIWSYPSERTEKSGLDGQPSPLMMAVSMVRIESSTGQLQTVLVAILLSMGIAVAFVGWFVFKSRKSEPRNELPEKIEAW